MEVIFEALTGLRFSMESIVGLVVFYGIGMLFGKLTKNVGVIKILCVAVIAYYGFSLLANASGAFIVAFIIGLATNHISFTMEAIYWAEDISDLLYALRHPEAFEDIREAEQSQHSSESNKDKTEEPNHRASGGQSYQDSNERIEKQQPSSSKKGPSVKYLRILGLEPNTTYTVSELKKAYRKQALKTHPDTGGTDAEFKELNEAINRLLTY